MNNALSTLAILAQRAPRPLGEFWPHTPPQLAKIVITGVQQDSRLLRQGEAWLCLPSVHEKKEACMQMAAESGASLCIHVGALTHSLALPSLQLADMSVAGSWLRHWFSTQNTTTRIIGVTGTDGKTSVTWMLRHALEQKLARCWSAGTLGWMRQHDDCITLGNTTASLLHNHQLLAAASDAVIPYIVMEVSSHGIDQQRTAGMPFAAAIWTTMGRDHLDYHLSIRHYQACKADFIHAVAHSGGTIIANGDQTDITMLQEGHATWWYAQGKDPCKQTLAWHLPHAGQLELRAKSTTITVSPVPNGFIHGQNLAAVATCLHRHFGDDLQTIAAYLSAVDAPPGRMQLVVDPYKRQVFVDYAHTPHALMACLRVARALSSKRLLLVFGCGGERDKGKRPLMGQAAMQHADMVWLTSDNPRGEDADDIISDIVSVSKDGGANTAVVCVVRERGEAIALAVAALRVGDVLVIAGKGHEDYMAFAGGQRQPWSDVAVAAKALEATPLC